MAALPVVNIVFLTYMAGQAQGFVGLQGSARGRCGCPAEKPEPLSDRTASSLDCFGGF
jgi:hypothetical protein